MEQKFVKNTLMSLQLLVTKEVMELKHLDDQALLVARGTTNGTEV